MNTGSVVLVQEQTAGSELIADAAIGATAFTLEDAIDFVDDGGDLKIGAQELSYTAADDETGIVTLSAATTVAYVSGDRVLPLPITIERFAHVAIEEDEEVLVARVPHTLYDRLPLGVRDENLDEREMVEVASSPDGELVVVDVVAREPIIHVRGVEIDAGVSAIPPSDSRIRWTRASDGATVAEVYGYEEAGFNQDVAILARPLDDDEAFAWVHAGNGEPNTGNGQPSADVYAYVYPTTGAARVMAQTVTAAGGVTTRRVLAQSGRSDFLSEGARFAVTQNEPAIAAGAEANVDLALPAGTCLLNDKVVAINPAGLTAGVVVKRVHPVAPAADTARVILLNTTGAATVAVSRTWHVWVLTTL